MEQQVQVKPVSKPQTIEQPVDKKPVIDSTSEQTIDEKPTGKKFYQEWWFWLVVGVAVVGLILGLFLI